MKKIWSNRWKKAFIWLSGYINFVAYAVVGGYVVAKSEDKELRKTAKTAFIVTLIFTAISAFQTILSQINNVSGYNNDFATFLSWFGFFITLAKIAVYATFIILSLFGGSEETGESSMNMQKEPDQTAQAEQNDNGAKK